MVTRIFLHMLVRECSPSPPATAGVLATSQCRGLGVEWLLAGGMGREVGHVQSRSPTGVPECREALLILPAPGGLALIEHCLERRCFIVPGHI